MLSLLLASDAMAGGRYPGAGRGGNRGGGGQWPRGGGANGPLGGIIFDRRGGMGSRTHTAGTAEIARDSGGDSISVDDASALEDTLSRIRQRYALHFHLPDAVAPGGASEARRWSRAARQCRRLGVRSPMRRNSRIKGGRLSMSPGFPWAHSSSRQKLIRIACSRTAGTSDASATTKASGANG